MVRMDRVIVGLCGYSHEPAGALVLLYILQKTSEFAADFNWQRLATVLGKDDNDDPDELEWNAWPEFLAAFGLVEGETRRVRKDKMLQKYDEFKVTCTAARQFVSSSDSIISRNRTETTRTCCRFI